MPKRIRPTPAPRPAAPASQAAKQVAATQPVAMLVSPEDLAKAEESPFVDSKDWIKISGLEDLRASFASNLSRIAKSKFFSPLEAAVFIDTTTGKGLNDIESRYQRFRGAHPVESQRINLCKWTEKKLQAWLKIRSQLTVNSTNCREISAWFNDFIDNTLKPEASQAARYKVFVAEQIAVLEKLRPTDDYSKEEIIIYQRALHSYLFHHLLPRELAEHGIYKEEFIVKGQRVPVYCLTTQHKEYKSLNGLDIPVVYHIYLGGGQEPNSTINRNGTSYINLEILEKQYLEYIFNARQINNGFERLFAAKPNVNFYHNPMLLKQFLGANVYRHINSDDSEVTKAGYLDCLIKEDLQAMVIGSFLDTQAYHSANNPALFYGATSSLLQQCMPSLFRRGSEMESIYENLLVEYPQDEISSLDNFAVNWVINDLIHMEAKLRVLAEREPSPSVLADVLSNVILPVPDDERYQVRQVDSKRPKMIIEVLMTKFLTEELFPNGKEISSKVDWDKLMRFDFGSENSFTYQWREYIKNPEKFPDPMGLMQLRAEWYKFADKEFGRFDKFKSFIASQRIQKAAAKVLDREFTSYRDRNRSFPNWQEYFKQHLAVRPKTRSS